MPLLGDPKAAHTDCCAARPRLQGQVSAHRPLPPRLLCSGHYYSLTRAHICKIVAYIQRTRHGCAACDFRAERSHDSQVQRHFLVGRPPLHQVAFRPQRAIGDTLRHLRIDDVIAGAPWSKPKSHAGHRVLCVETVGCLHTCEWDQLRMDEPVRFACEQVQHRLHCRHCLRVPLMVRPVVLVRLKRLTGSHRPSTHHLPTGLAMVPHPANSRAMC